MPDQPALGLSPHITVKDGGAAIDFYTAAFGARLLGRSNAPHSEKVMHAAMDIHGSLLHLSDDFPEFMQGKSNTPEAHGGSPVTLNLKVGDADAAWAQAVAAGAEVRMPLKDQFWGDRYGQLRDPFGHTWAISQTIRRPDPAEIDREAEKIFT